MLGQQPIVNPEVTHVELTAHFRNISENRLMLVKTRIATYTCSRLGTISPTRSTFTSATSAYLGRGTLFHHLLMSVGRKNNSNI